MQLYKNLPKELHSLYERIHKEFQLAEEKLRLLENISDNLHMPVVNELRYVAFHLDKALASKDVTQQKADLSEAGDHAQRAYCDAVRIILLHRLEEIRLFKLDFKHVALTAIIPDFVQRMAKVNRIKESMATLNGRVSEEERKKLQEFDDYLKETGSILQASEEECMKKIKRQRLGLFLSVTGVVAGVVSLVVTLLLSL